MWKVILKEQYLKLIYPMSKAKIKVLIADDKEVYRDGLKMALMKSPRFEVVGEATDGEELVSQALALQPDVVLADMVMPMMDGDVATRKLLELHPDIGVVALSMYDKESMIMNMIDAGAIGYLVKNADTEEIYQAIERAYMRQPFYCKSTSAQLTKILTRKKRELSMPTVQLSDKEVQIIRGICDEMNNQEISKSLFMSKRTVDGYRSRILEKLNVKTSIGVVKYAIKTGLYQL
jgi:DNA-binding NarL/FixJ family response regulator